MSIKKVSYINYISSHIHGQYWSHEIDEALASAAEYPAHWVGLCESIHEYLKTEQSTRIGDPIAEAISWILESIRERRSRDARALQ